MKGSRIEGEYEEPDDFAIVQNRGNPWCFPSVSDCFKRQELTDALKYCIDLLKDAQIIIDLQNSRETISKLSQHMGKEIQRRIIDMLHFMEFEDDGEMVKCKEETLSCPLEEFSCSTK
ncbi:unnamed protein product [Lasius platythorax]|uniref:Uncharacterized protein n=1 Tax=Lasius platythorax TaxID=488582 RepID=A0AAV2N5B1_9HYME